jgi:hypothetical protein
MPKESSGTQVVATRLTSAEIADLQAIGAQLSRQASGVSVATAEVMAIALRREIPRWKAELGLGAKPTKSTKSTAA